MEIKLYDENFMEYNDENFYQDDYWDVNHNSTWELTPTRSINFKMKFKEIDFNLGTSTYTATTAVAMC